MEILSINLNDRFGDRFKIRFQHERESRFDPWSMSIPCERGR